MNGFLRLLSLSAESSERMQIDQITQKVFRFTYHLAQADIRSSCSSRLTLENVRHSLFDLIISLCDLIFLDA